ncbi:MAG: peptidylprolyl isomerase [Gemmatimonadaceae bacterium]|nr:peptidylprolyl isomerase [Gemmatimonadaceae bacterium]
MMPARARTTAILFMCALVSSGCAARSGATSDLTLQPPPPTVMTPPPDAALLATADSFLVRFATTKGDFDVMLRKSWAPRGAERVGELVLANYYDGARFFRALPGFVVQWGIAADTAMTRAWSGRRIADDSVRESNRRGTVTFGAGGQANTRTVHLFVNLRDNARLDATRFAPVGEVVRGMDVVDQLYTGYGEGAPAGKGPSQQAMSQEGEALLARDFPLLDQIKTARVVRLFSAAPSSSASALPSTSASPSASPSSALRPASSPAPAASRARASGTPRSAP